MEVVSLQVCDLECLHLLVGDLDALLVGVGVEYRLDRQTGLGGGRRDRLDDNLVGFQGSTAPVHGDRGEHPVLDFVHLEVPGGRWHTVISRPVSAASWPSSVFHNRSRAPLDPPPSAVISSALAS